MRMLKEKKQKLLRFLFGSFSFTALMFAFQACYGVPKDYYYIEGKVVSAKDGKPLQNIQVYNNYYGKQSASQTMYDGSFFVNVDVKATSATLCFRDVDGEENGSFTKLDTLVEIQDLNAPLTIELLETNGDN